MSMLNWSPKPSPVPISVGRMTHWEGASFHVPLALTASGTTQSVLVAQPTVGSSRTLRAQKRQRQQVSVR